MRHEKTASSKPGKACACCRELREIIKEMHERLSRSKELHQEALSDAYKVLEVTAQKSLQQQRCLRRLLDAKILPEGELKRKVLVLLREKENE